MTTYRTSEVARRVGLHPNTVRKYEEWALIPPPERLANGYRVYTDFHIDLIKLARKAFQIELLHGDLRYKMVAMVKAAAKKEYPEAQRHLENYQKTLQMETLKAKKAAAITAELLHQHRETQDTGSYSRKAIAEKFAMTVDSLRNWELNGLLEPKRQTNGHRYYTQQDLAKIQVIKVLRDAKYSLEAILRMLREVSADPAASIPATLDRLDEEAEIVSVCDHLISSLEEGWRNAEEVKELLQELVRRYPE